MLGDIIDYNVISVIGSGSFGTCYKVQRKKDGDIFVWKSIDYGNLTEEEKELLVSEVNLLRAVRHQNVVSYYGYIIHKESTTLYVVMELCENGDLAALIENCKKAGTHIEEGFIWRLLYQISNALRALQCQGILHRDIKPANIFLDHKYDAKLGDFGLAKCVGLPSAAVSHAQSFVGTPGYMSPEVVKGERYDGKSDVWALGCVAYELCSLKTPFMGRNMKQLARHIASGRFAPVPSHYSSELRNIIDFMLTVNSSVRPDIRAILHHPSVVSHLSACQTIPPLPINKPSADTLSERETLLRMRELALEVKEKQIQKRENKLKCIKNIDLDSSAGLDDSPLFRPTTAKLNPALIPRPLNFPLPPRKVRFQPKPNKTDNIIHKPSVQENDTVYKWYEIDPPKSYQNIDTRRPLSDSGQIQTKSNVIPGKPSSDSGTNKDSNLRGKYTFQDLEKAVVDKLVNHNTCGGKENLGPVKHTML